MDIGKSFSYIFEDPRWLTKVAIGTLVLLVSSILTSILVGFLGYFIVAGYALEVVRNVRRGDPYPLPEWRDRWGEWLVLGVKLFVAILVWSLPLIIVSLPMIVGFALTGDQDTAGVGWIIGACMSCLVLLWGLVVLLVTPVIYIRLAETEDLSGAFRFGDILSFTREHLGEVVIVTIVYVIASIVVGLIGTVVGLILCVIGVVITLPAAQLITMLIQSHLYAQVGRTHALQPAYAAAPMPPAPPAPPAESQAVTTTETVPPPPVVPTSTDVEPGSTPSEPEL